MPVPRLTLLLAVGSILSVPACSDDGSLSKSEVTSLPEGDASGSARSGEYEVEIYTADCTGACSAANELWTISFCDVGDRDDQSFAAIQNDGALQIDGDDGNYVPRMRGGIDQDGAFDVGGYATESGGELESTARVRGTIDQDGAVEAVADIHVAGRSNDARIDCRATYELSGRRISSAD